MLCFMLIKMKTLLITVTFLLTISIIIKGQTYNLNSTKFKVGDKYVPRPNILFDFGKWSIKPENYSLIDSIANFLIENSNLKIEIGYHLDYPRDPKSSIMLDMKRTQSISDYLISKGVSRERLLSKGYGNFLPYKVDSVTALKYKFFTNGQVLNEEFIKTLSNLDEKETANMLNRRAEFIITSININKTK
ncbi:MAG: hypothetical protein COX07_05860 [Bacteroidetes bacterium CG23_combo_of_CG06-09_8_20_14_all_32_9]|nr:MAG: hypothetical protein COX07_05860 [Bacteroidetes bacterium CG23_combo_of_CG06-09_8_20_14_all_32_9]